MYEDMFYVDLHSHILWGVDDGAKDKEMSREMLKMAYDQGIRTILATSHSYPNDSKGKHEKLAKRVEELNVIAQEMDSKFRVFTGNEILYRESIVAELEKNMVYTLADSQYVLVEFLPGEHYRRILHGVQRLVEHGYCPVIAHMERVNTLVKDKKHIQELMNAGAYMQMNAGSLLGSVFLKETRNLFKLIAEGYVHFLGSDCHNTTSRPPVMEQAVKKLRKKIPEDILKDLLENNPESLLHKEYI